MHAARSPESTSSAGYTVSQTSGHKVIAAMLHDHVNAQLREIATKPDSAYWSCEPYVPDRYRLQAPTSRPLNRQRLTLVTAR